MHGINGPCAALVRGLTGTTGQSELMREEKARIYTILALSTSSQGGGNVFKPLYL